MRIIDADAVAAALTAERLLPALERMFREGCTAPARHHHAIEVPGAPDAVLLLMPAWRSGAYLGIKIVTVFPGNSSRGLPAVSAGYLLMEGTSGVVLAMIDGEELTAKRTAATSALAARFLARPDARTLAVLGTGRIGRELARCHYAARPGLARVLVWGRSNDHAARLVSELRREGIPAAVASGLEAAVTAADIVSSATLATEPLIRGEWVRAGTHVDLVGGYNRAMREADDALIAKARVFGDTLDGVLSEPGDVVVPIERGVLAAASVVDLQSLCRGVHPGRRDAAEVTVFKSVGAALEDLAAAILVYESGRPQ